MRRLRQWLAMPQPGADPRDTLLWVRRIEIACGVVGVIAGLTIWDIGWWHWLLVGLGVLLLMPWGGASTILRKADRGQAVFETDRERGLARAKRTMLVIVPLTTLGSFGAGYLADGWGTAIFLGVSMGATTAGSAWWSLWRERRA